MVASHESQEQTAARFHFGVKRSVDSALQPAGRPGYQRSSARSGWRTVLNAWAVLCLNTPSDYPLNLAPESCRARTEDMTLILILEPVYVNMRSSYTPLELTLGRMFQLGEG